MLEVFRPGANCITLFAYVLLLDLNLKRVDLWPDVHNTWFWVLPRLCCDAIPQQDFNPILFSISVQV